MAYRIHFEDGSEAYLAHSGVKGMKWGVWNEETRRKYNAARDVSRQFKNDPAKAMSKDSRYGQVIANNPEVLKARKELIASRQEESRFYNDENLQKKYKLKAAEKAYERLKEDGLLEYEIRDRKGNVTKHETSKEDLVKGYLYDDFDQGTDNSFSLYLDDKFDSGKLNREKYFERQNKAWDNYNKAVGNAVDDLLGEYGSIHVDPSIFSPNRYYAGRTLKEVVTSAARFAGQYEDDDRYKLYGDYSSSRK